MAAGDSGFDLDGRARVRLRLGAVRLGQLALHHRGDDLHLRRLFRGGGGDGQNRRRLAVGVHAGYGRLRRRYPQPRPRRHRRPWQGPQGVDCLLDAADGRRVGCPVVGCARPESTMLVLGAASRAWLPSRWESSSTTPCCRGWRRRAIWAGCPAGPGGSAISAGWSASWCCCSGSSSPRSRPSALTDGVGTCAHRRAGGRPVGAGLQPAAVLPHHGCAGRRTVHGAGRRRRAARAVQDPRQYPRAPEHRPLPAGPDLLYRRLEHDLRRGAIYAAAVFGMGIEEV